MPFIHRRFHRPDQRQLSGEGLQAGRGPQYLRLRKDGPWSPQGRLVGRLQKWDQQVAHHVRLQTHQSRIQILGNAGITSNKFCLKGKKIC